MNWQQDPHGNWQARFVFPEKVTEFKIEADLTAELAVINPFDFFIEPYAEQFPFAFTPELKAELAPYLDADPLGPRLAAYIAGLPKGPVHIVTLLVDLNIALQKAIRYLIRMEPGVQTPEETLELGSGSCRDSAWLLVQMLRHLGLAARHRFPRSEKSAPGHAPKRPGRGKAGAFHSRASSRQNSQTH